MPRQARNVVIHGLKPVENMEIAEIILDMCQTVGCVIFASDILDITRLDPYNKPSAKPPPVQLPTYNLLRRKSKLADHVKFANMFVSPDEPIEQRRVRGIFRRVAQKA